MSNKRKSFVLMTDTCAGVLDVLTDEQAGALFRAVVRYADTGAKPETTDAPVLVAFASLRVLLDIHAKKYDEICEKRREAGRKGGAPAGNQNARKNNQNNQKQPKQAINDNVNKNVNENVTVNDNDDALISARAAKFSALREAMLSPINTENLCMAYNIDKFTYIKLAEQIFSEWEAADEPDVNKRHFVAVLRNKAADALRDAARATKKSKQQWQSELVNGAAAVFIDTLNKSNN